MRDKPDFTPVFKLMDLFEAIEERKRFRRRVVVAAIAGVIAGALLLFI